MKSIKQLRKCKKCKLMISLTGKQPTHCGAVALPLKDTIICKAHKIIYEGKSKRNWGDN